MTKRGQLVISGLACVALLAAACGDGTNPPKPDSMVPDTLVVDLGVDTGQPDTIQPDTVGDDMTQTDMPQVDSATSDQSVSPDATVISGNGTCAAAATITLVSGKGASAGSTASFNDEFSGGVSCSRFSTSSTIMDGPQAYFKFTAVKDQLYKITTTTDFSSYTYVFTSSACTAAAISADCQSDGATGIRSSSLYSGDKEPLYFFAPAAGDVYFAVDSTSSTISGAYTVLVEAIPTPTNITCSAATAVPLTGGKATITGDLDAVIAPDEFATLACPSSSSSNVMDGPNRYYKFAASAGKAYKLKLTALTVDYVRMYYFTSSSCSATAIATDCQSSGATGGGTSSSAFPGGFSQPLIYTPTTSGTVTLAVDYTSADYHGEFQLEIEEVPVPTNTTCSAAKLITLTGGKATVKHDTTFSTDEFATLACKTTGSTSTTSALAGGQLYYKWATTAGQWYKLVLSPTDVSQYLYVFTSAACTAAAIQTDCQSGGATGYAIGSVYSGDSEALYFKAPSTGTAFFAVDSTGFTGEFEVSIEAISSPNNGTCIGAQTITLTGGKGSVKGDTSPDLTPDEFATLQCGTSTLAFDGPQAYYSVSLLSTKTYVISLTADSAYGIYAYLFSNTCTEATIQTDCKSAGVTGDLTDIAYPGDMEFFTFTPPSSGIYKIAVDSKYPYYYGGFTLSVEEFIPAANDTCQAAQVVTLTAGKATVTGSKKTNASDKMIACGSDTLAATDLFYKFTPVTGKQYKVTFRPVNNDGRFGVWDGNHNCVQANLTTECGKLGSSFVTAGASGTLTITATTGDIYIVADGLSSFYNIYDFSFDIEQLP